MSALGTSFSRHILEQAQEHPDLEGPLAPLLTQIGYAAKVLSREISRAALVGKLGLVGEKNATGDTQKVLDIFSNDTVIDAFVNTGLVWAIVSEELDGPRCVSCENDAQYVLCIDPLDGSSNVDVNGDVGTIFGIYRRDDAAGDAETVFLKKGSEQVAAGYVLYGASTVFVYTVGRGAHAFTFDRELGEFLLSHEAIKCPAKGKTYSANLSHLSDWTPGIQAFVEHAAGGGQSYSLRYNGALVADFHRCLIEGGIYFYPGGSVQPEGKLRLLYECAPLAFIAEQAGGRATDGVQRILDIQAVSIHQRSPFAIGSAEDVSRFERFFQRGEKA